MDFDIVDDLNLKDRDYDEDEVIKKLQSLGLKEEAPIRDKILDNFFANFLNLNKWHP